MSNLQHRQQKIQEKRKQTPWREFVMEICSWQNLVLKKDGSTISKYTDPLRSGNVVGVKAYIENEPILESGISITTDFMSQLTSFFQSTPKASLMHFATNENSDFADIVGFAKNVYLSFHVTLNSENIAYSIAVKDSCDAVIDSMSVNLSTNVYSSRGVSQSYNVFYSSVVLNCSNVRNCSNCISCEECIGCYNISNQKYMIDNTQYTKDEYLQRKYEILQNRNYMSGLNKISNLDCENSSGIGLLHCKSLENGFFAINIAQSRNTIFTSAKETNYHEYDLILGGGNPGEGHYYGGVSCGGCTHVYCSIGMAWCANCYYSYHLDNCSFCLGCIGLKNKSYCIFNTQYTKEERYEKVDQIFAQMDKEGTLGQFFPATMNPFYFNDTAAYLIMGSGGTELRSTAGQAFTKEEVEAKGYLRRDEPIKVDIPEGVEVVKVSELGQFEGRRPVQTKHAGTHGNASDEKERYIDPDILKKVIQDEQGNIYRIVKMEYDFLVKHGLPLPRKHWLERMKENFRIS